MRAAVASEILELAARIPGSSEQALPSPSGNPSRTGTVLFDLLGSKTWIIASDPRGQDRILAWPRDQHLRLASIWEHYRREPGVFASREFRSLAVGVPPESASIPVALETR